MNSVREKSLAIFGDVLITSRSTNIGKNSEREAKHKRPRCVGLISARYFFTELRMSRDFKNWFADCYPAELIFF
jgi:hypothetical protein